MAVSASLPPILMKFTTNVILYMGGIHYGWHIVVWRSLVTRFGYARSPSSVGLAKKILEPKNRGGGMGANGSAFSYIPPATTS